MYERILNLKNDFEAQRFGNILEQEAIPHYIRSNHDTAYDGIYQMALGWGYVMAPPEFRQRIEQLYAGYTAAGAGEPEDGSPSGDTPGGNVTGSEG